MIVALQEQMQFKCWFTSRCILKLYVPDWTLVGFQQPDQQHVCPVIARIEKYLTAASYLLKKAENLSKAAQRMTNPRDFLLPEWCQLTI